MPVVLPVPSDFPCLLWTPEDIRQRCGDNMATVRVKNEGEHSYRMGRNYSQAQMRVGDYIDQLLRGTAKARRTYLAIQNLNTTFPQLESEVPQLEYCGGNCGRLHKGPYMWIACKGHYEYNHMDPDDNLLLVVSGVKRVRLFSPQFGGLRSLYPNPLGSPGKAIQSRVDLDAPDCVAHPEFAKYLGRSPDNASRTGDEANECSWCGECFLRPGEMLFIPAFFWHQVTSEENCISINTFFGDAGENLFLQKLLREDGAQFDAFRHWLLNVIEQNRTMKSFRRVRRDLPGALRSFLLHEWHEIPSESQLDRLCDIVRGYLAERERGCAEPNDDEDGGEGHRNSRHPPSLEIRHMRH